MSKHERRAPRQSQLKLKLSKSKEKIQLSKWREQACFWCQNSNYLYHRKWREQAFFSRWRQISNSNRMRNICRNGARSEADLAQCGALALPPPFLFLWLLVQIFFNAPFSNSVSFHFRQTFPEKVLVFSNHALLKSFAQRKKQSSPDVRLHAGSSSDRCSEVLTAKGQVPHDEACRSLLIAAHVDSFRSTPNCSHHKQLARLTSLSFVRVGNESRL